MVRSIFDIMLDIENYVMVPSSKKGFAARRPSPGDMGPAPEVSRETLRVNFSDTVLAPSNRLRYADSDSEHPIAGFVATLGNEIPSLPEM